MTTFPVIDLKATGANIVRLRKECGLSVKDLQDYFGFECPQAIYKWQWGDWDIIVTSLRKPYKQGISEVSPTISF